MGVQLISEKLLLSDKKDVVRLHLYARLLDKGQIPYEKDLDVLITLYEMGGYSNGDEQSEFFDICIKKDFKKSKQSVRNTLSKYTEIGMLVKPKNERRFFSDEWLPSKEDGRLILDYKVSHN